MSLIYIDLKINKAELEKIILSDLTNKIYPELEQKVFDYFKKLRFT